MRHQPYPTKPRRKNTRVGPARPRWFHEVDLTDVEDDCENPDWLVGAN